ncbi:hypothetical protein [Streptomyces sp. NPDC057460]|uniref:hypothetical protein n=1 Tax=Streptomyces sp. NPDC057460 TaxID=3346141 RepID=UPI00369D2420
MESLAGTLPLPSRLPIGVVIRDTQLRCIWVNAIQASKNGIPHPQRLSHRLTQAVPGAEDETWADQRLYDYLQRFFRSAPPPLREEFPNQVKD